MIDYTYMIVNVSEINLIDFAQVAQTSADTVRRNVDNTRFLIKWLGAEPDFVSGLQTKSQTYTHEEIRSIMTQPEWSNFPLPIRT